MKYGQAAMSKAQRILINRGWQRDLAAEEASPHPEGAMVYAKDNPNDPSVDRCIIYNSGEVRLNNVDADGFRRRIKEMAFDFGVWRGWMAPEFKRALKFDAHALTNLGVESRRQGADLMGHIRTFTAPICWACVVYTILNLL